MTTLGRVMSGAFKMVPGATGPSGTITYKQQQAPPGFQVDGCRKRPIHASEKNMGGAYIGSSNTVWFIPAANLNGVVPVPGDSVTFGTTFWVLEWVESGLQEADWKCFGIQNR